MSDYYEDDAMTQALVEMIMGGGGGSYLGGATPTMSPGQYNSLAGTVPSDNDVLKQQARGLNFAQDLASSGADTMFLANIGLGAYDPNAFAPLVSQEVVESPALQLFNSYLRNPMSYQGLIAKRISEGGNPLEVVAELQQEVGMTPDFNDPALGPLLGQLPKFYDEEPGGTGAPLGINWNQVQEDALSMANEWASIPVPGPSGLTVSDSGEIISEGGEVQMVGEPGYQQLIETMYTPSPQMEEYQRLGIPLPSEEFTPAYILGPEWEAAEQDYLARSTEVDAAKQAWMDPSLRPDNTYEPARPWKAPANLTEEQLRAKGAPDQPDYSPLPEGAYGFWNDPNEPDRTEAAAWEELMNGAYGGWNVTNPLQNVTAEDRMRQAETNAYGAWNTLNQGESAGPGDPRDFAYGDWERNNEEEAAPSPNTAADARNAWLAAQEYLTNPSAAATPGYGSWNTLNQSTNQVQPAVDPAAVYGGWNAQGFMGQPTMGGPLPANASSYIAPRGFDPSTVGGQTFWPTVPPPPRPPIAGGGALDPYLDNYTQPATPPGLAMLQQVTQRTAPPPTPDYATSPYDQLRQQATSPDDLPRRADFLNYPMGRTATPDQLAQILGQQPTPPGPDYGMPSATDQLQQQAEAQREAMLRQILPGNGQSTMNQPGPTPDYATSPYDQLRQQGPSPDYATSPYDQMREQMLRYSFPEIATGEQVRDTRNESERTGEAVLGGSTDRTGKRKRATRSPGQAWRHRQAFQEWDRLTDEQFRRKQEVYGADHGYAMGVAYALQQQGITPTQAVMSARQLPAQAMGVTSPDRLAAYMSR